MNDIRLYPMRARLIRVPVKRKYRFRFEKHGHHAYIELTDTSKAGAFRQLTERSDTPWEYRLVKQEPVK